MVAMATVTIPVEYLADAYYPKEALLCIKDVLNTIEGRGVIEASLWW